MKNKKIILIASSLLVSAMLAGCGNSTTQTNSKVEKLALTKENVQKVFANEYTVEVDNIQYGNVEATFVAKKNVNRKDAVKLIKDIRKTLHENFKIDNSNHIQLNNYNNKLLGSTSSDEDKIVIGNCPVINIKEPLNLPKYSMATKFNLLNPAENVQVTATDDEDGNLTNKIKLKNSDVLSKIGNQTLTYEVTDSDGNTKDTDLDIEVTK